MSAIFLSDYMTTDYSRPVNGTAPGLDPYPQTEAGWRQEYWRRWNVYMNAPYSPAEQKAEHLFRAFDDAQKEIAQTRRLFRYPAFVADIDANALAAAEVVLEIDEDEDPATLEHGQAIWRRSETTVALPMWDTMTMALGDWWIEPVRMSGKRPYRTKLIGRDPRIVTPTYDDTGTELEEVRIEFGYLGMPEFSGMEQVRNSYVRILTRKEIVVERNGVKVEAESGPHPLGIVPIVHRRAILWEMPEHSLPAYAGIDRAVMNLDSIATQFQAIGVRFGQPTMFTKGFTLATGSAVSQIGHIISGIPADTPNQSGQSVGYLETNLGQLGQLLAHAESIHEHITATCPEFLFATGATESGIARSLRASSFQSKIRTMRGHNYAALARVTEMAACLDDGVAWSEDTEMFRIGAPPILPADVKSEVETMVLVKDEMKHADFVRGLQRLGVISSECNAEEYAAEVEDERAARATSFFSTGAVPGMPKPGVANPAVAQAPKAYNGIQITSANDILDRVAARTIVPELGEIELVKLLLIDPADAKEMIRLAQLGDVAAAMANVSAGGQARSHTAGASPAAPGAP